MSVKVDVGCVTRGIVGTKAGRLDVEGSRGTRGVNDSQLESRATRMSAGGFGKKTSGEKKRRGETGQRARRREEKRLLQARSGGSRKLSTEMGKALLVC